MDELTLYGEEAQADRIAGPSASNVGGCQKRTAGQFLGIPETNPRNTDAADLGTLLHLGYSAVINSRYPDDSHSAPYPIPVPELGRTVEADHVDWNDRVVDDLKSAKKVIFQSWVNRGTPPDDYWDQAEFYAFLLRRQHGGDWTLRITAFNRETGERATFEQPADPERGKVLFDRQVSLLRRLNDDLAETVDGGPDDVWNNYLRGGKGPGTGFPCDYCEFLDACWPPTGPDDPRTPQSKSIDGDPAAVEDALRQYDEGRALAGKGKRLQDEAKAFLRGLTGGVYGRFTLGWGNPSGGGEVPDCEAMAAYFTEKGMAIPTTTAQVKRGAIQVNRRKDG